MITFLVARGFDFTVRPLLGEVCAPQVNVSSYDDTLPKHSLVKATYVFTDLDRLGVNELIDAARLYRRLQESGCRVLNNPATARKRFALLRGLYLRGSNPFNVYFADEGRSDFRFPVFIRVADQHDGPLTRLISDQAELETAIDAASVAGIPLSTIIIVEYAAEPIRPGVFRKGSIQRVGKRLITTINWHGDDWLVEGDQYALTDEALYDEELSMVREDRYASEASEAFEFANIEYGRMDFSLVDGRLCVYEINMNPTLVAPGPHSAPQRMESSRLRWSRFLDALHAIDTKEEAVEVEVHGLSIEAWNQAASLYPALRVPRRRLGQDRRALSRHREQHHDPEMALRYAKEAVAANPRGLMEHKYLAQLLSSQGQAERAVAAARKAVELSKQLPQYILLANILLKFERYAEARDAAEKAIELSTGEWEPHLLLSKTLLRLGEVEHAHRSAMRGHDLGLREPRACLWYETINERLGEEYLKAGRFAEARNCLQIASAGTRADTMTHLHLTKACLRLGDLRGALRASGRAARRDLRGVLRASGLAAKREVVRFLSRNAVPGSPAQ